MEPAAARCGCGSQLLLLHVDNEAFNCEIVVGQDITRHHAKISDCVWLAIVWHSHLRIIRNQLS